MVFHAYGRVVRFQRHIGKVLKIGWKFKLHGDYTMHLWTGKKVEKFLMDKYWYDKMGLTRGDFVEVQGHIFYNDKFRWSVAYIHHIRQPGRFDDDVIEPATRTPFITDDPREWQEWTE